jgi:hypothetical protein
MEVKTGPFGRTSLMRSTYTVRMGGEEGKRRLAIGTKNLQDQLLTCPFLYTFRSREYFSYFNFFQKQCSNYPDVLFVLR